MKIYLLLALIFCWLFTSTLHAEEPWTEHLKWAEGNTGAPDCPDQYNGFGQKAQECLALGIGGATGQGNRRCLMTLASQAASNNKCGDAFQMVLTTQCHNNSVRDQLRIVGEKKICDWLAGR